MKKETIHAHILKSLKLKVGDTVKVTHKVPSFNLEWGSNWAFDMNQAIGRIFTVEEIDENRGVKLNFNVGCVHNYEFPAQCLEVVKRADSNIEMISVDWKDIDGAFEQFAAAVKKMGLYAYFSPSHSGTDQLGLIISKTKFKSAKAAEAAAEANSME